MISLEIIIRILINIDNSKYYNLIKIGGFTDTIRVNDGLFLMWQE